MLNKERSNKESGQLEFPEQKSTRRFPLGCLGNRKFSTIQNGQISKPFRIFLSGKVKQMVPSVKLNYKIKKNIRFDIQIYILLPFCFVFAGFPKKTLRRGRKSAARITDPRTSWMCFFLPFLLLLQLRPSKKIVGKC